MMLETLRLKTKSLKSNVVLPLVLSAALLLQGCARAHFNQAATCPPVVEYSQADMDAAAFWLEGTENDHIIKIMIDDYLTLRDMVRACYEAT